MLLQNSGEEFHHHKAVKLEIETLVDHTRSVLAQELNDLEMADRLARVHQHKVHGEGKCPNLHRCSMEVKYPSSGVPRLPHRAERCIILQIRVQ